MPIRSSELARIANCHGIHFNHGQLQQSFDGILWLTLLTKSLLHRAYETGDKAQYGH